MSEDKNKKEELTKMQEKVRADLQAGKIPAAKAALTRSWRDAVPDLPQRFSLVLVRVDHKAANEVVLRIKKNKGAVPPVQLFEEEGSIGVRLSRGDKLVLGFLPGSEARLLQEMGSGMKNYRPKLLEVRKKEEGRDRYVAIELVRKEKQKKRAPKHDFEHTPVQIQEAVDALIEEVDLGDEDLF